jgi:SH3-like domain-containing protein
MGDGGRMRADGFQTIGRRLRGPSFFVTALAAMLLAGGAACAQQTAAANGEQIGNVTGLTLPRYASLKTDRVNLREGPRKDYATKWVFQRAGLPVEITAESDTWRKVRDSEGAEGWVLHSLLSGRRTGLVAPGKKDQNFKIFVRASESADLAATLQSGVIGNIRNCDGAWCLIDGDGFRGYIKQSNLWGVYPDEKIE